MLDQHSTDNMPCGLQGPMRRRNNLTHVMLDSILTSKLSREEGGSEAVYRLIVSILWNLDLKAISLTGCTGLPSSCSQPLIALASLRPCVFSLRDVLRTPPTVTTLSRKEAFLRACCRSYYEVTQEANEGFRKYLF